MIQNQTEEGITEKVKENKIPEKEKELFFR